ncbi:MAG: kinase [Porticoccaceae bacterium]|nr:MAG: kinase [Porticoccaceae bacterium]
MAGRTEAANSTAAALADALARRAAGRSRPLVVGIAGAPGSGKTTLAAHLARLLEERHRLPAVVLSLDDFYLPRAARRRLARRLHPLFAVRGVPGTHDLRLLGRTFAALERAQGDSCLLLPVFDKLADDRLPRRHWRLHRGRPVVILLEGWCVGVPPEPPAALARPVNALERTRDPDGCWRRAVNRALAGPYRRLFARLDCLIFLRAPAWGVVVRWRLEQERALAAARPGAKAMDAAQVAHFVAHFERLTRHALRVLPRRADYLLHLAPDRRPRLQCARR